MTAVDALQDIISISRHTPNDRGTIPIPDYRQEIIAKAGAQLAGVIGTAQDFLVQSRPNDNGTSAQAISAAALTINDMIETQTVDLTEHGRRPLEAAAATLRAAIGGVNLSTPDGQEFPAVHTDLLTAVHAIQDVITTSRMAEGDGPIASEVRRATNAAKAAPAR